MQINLVECWITALALNIHGDIHKNLSVCAKKAQRIQKLKIQSPSSSLKTWIFRASTETYLKEQFKITMYRRQFIIKLPKYKLRGGILFAYKLHCHSIVGCESPVGLSCFVSKKKSPVAYYLHSKNKTHCKLSKIRGCKHNMQRKTDVTSLLIQNMV